MARMKMSIKDNIKNWFSGFDGFTIAILVSLFLMVTAIVLGLSMWMEQ